ncbi:MAG: C1 family peptidase [bacterium]|nr:C1 family peptidase [bacterium]
METNESKAVFQPTPDQLIKRCSVVRDAPDNRDWIAAAAHPSVELSHDPLPPSVDYSDDTPLVEDQGDYGSCVGWAAVRGLREWMYWKKTGKRVSLSVRFVWMAAKETDHFEINSFVANAGTSLKTAFSVLSKYGVPEDKYYPYKDELIFFTSLKQKRQFFFNASKYRIFNYYMLAANPMKKLHLANVGPFVATVPIDNNWLSVGCDGIIPDNGGGSSFGGHAVCIVGYDDRTQQFKFKNSWGKAWGDNGFGYFSYKYSQENMWTAIGTDPVPEVSER